jgi:RNA polymerase sigma-70 factor (ECF subfamily)
VSKLTTEDRLIQRARSGDRTAFGGLVQRYQNRILKLAYDFLGDFEQAKDAAQEIFMKAFNKVHTFEARSSFPTWINKIAVNTCLDIQRQQKRRPIHEQLSKQSAEQTSPTQALESRDLLETALKDLSEKQKTVLILRYFQGMTVLEISEILEIAENTVRIHIYRAMNKLRQKLREE